MKRIFKFYSLFLIMIMSFFVLTTLKTEEVVAASYDSYYASVDTSSGQALQKSLTSIISTGTKDLGYSGLWGAYKTTDVKPGTNYIWDMYSNYNYTVGGSKQGGNYSKEGDAYNREHSIPQSWFSEKSPMKSDLFHVYPTDGYVNNRRSNYCFGETNSPTYTSGNGSKLGPSSNSLYSGTVFEPIDEYKGDFARTYFYMATRYSSQVGNWSGNATAVFKGSYPYLSNYSIDLFVKWHELDPVSEKETTRNDAVYTLQKNRNPYIDHPEYVGMIFGTADLPAPTTYTVTYNVPSGVSFAYSDTTKYVANALVKEPTITPTKAGYIFEGWYTNSSYTTKWDFSTNKITANLTLYAKFSEDILNKSFEEIFETLKIKSQLVFFANQTGSSSTTTGTQSLVFKGTGSLNSNPATFDLSQYITYDTSMFVMTYVKNESEYAYVSTSQVRLYPGTTGNGSAVEINAKEGVKITAINLTYASDTKNQLTGDQLKISEDGSSAILQNKATSGQCRITSIKISYEKTVGSIENELVDGTLKIRYVLVLSKDIYNKYLDCDDALVFTIDGVETKYDTLDYGNEYYLVCTIDISDKNKVYVPKISLGNKEISINGYSAKTLAKYYLDNLSSDTLVLQSKKLLTELSN